jgi:hypothetical protein
MDAAREGLVDELHRTVAEIDQGLSEVKREILKALGHFGNEG